MLDNLILQGYDDYQISEFTGNLIIVDVKVKDKWIPIKTSRLEILQKGMGAIIDDVDCISLNLIVDKRIKEKA